MATVKQVGTCVEHPQFVYLARTKPGASYTFAHVMELSSPDDAARLCLLSLKMMERYETEQPDAQQRQSRMHKALQGKGGVIVKHACQRSVIFIILPSRI
jgi:hypothetical protein